MMNRKILLLLLILGSGSILATVYASNTTITNTSVSTTTVNTSDLVASHDVNTTNLFVTGTCSGCGAMEGSYNSYSTTLNQTVTGSQATTIVGLQSANDGSILGLDFHRASLVLVNGTVIKNIPTIPNFQSDQRLTSQSVNGVYFVALNSTGNILVYKNHVLLTTIGIKTSQFYLGNLNTASIVMSPNGKYIALYGADSGNVLDRLLIFQGS